MDLGSGHTSAHPVTTHSTSVYHALFCDENLRSFLCNILCVGVCKCVLFSRIKAAAGVNSLIVHSYLRNHVQYKWIILYVVFIYLFDI